jgi:hypothetical protein
MSEGFPYGYLKTIPIHKGAALTSIARKGGLLTILFTSILGLILIILIPIIYVTGFIYALILIIFFEPKTSKIEDSKHSWIYVIKYYAN